MSGDRKRDGVQRPRLVPQPTVPPGPLHDLKRLLYELYLAAGAPPLDQISALIADDDELPGAPGRDTVHRIVGGSTLPPSQADIVSVARVLARIAAWDEDDAARRARQLWITASLAVPLGTPIKELTDPFALEVHRPIDPDGPESVPLLPPYVRRKHDERLAHLASEAVAGQSRIAVLVGGSSTGKTRAWWETILTLPNGWRLWHPLDPTRTEAALAGLHQVGPRTVVWLNETQLYLDTPGDHGERVAAALRNVLADSTRAPVLIAGSMWPEHWNRLTHQAVHDDRHAQARQLLTGNDIHVPGSFTESDMQALGELAERDTRLRAALESGHNGAVTQFLAGAPELLARYRYAPSAARALIEAAIDARRLGHGPALPENLLEAAVPGYLSDDEWDALPDNWLEQALSYTAAPCRGVRGPLTRVRARPADVPLGSRSVSGGRPAYRLSDYLEQIGRQDRLTSLPPATFWRATAMFADLDAKYFLAVAAHDRGLWRYAVQCYEVLIREGRADAAARRNEILAAVAPNDAVVAGRIAAEEVDLTDAAAVASLLIEFERSQAEDAIATLLARNPAAHADLRSIGKVESLIEALHAVRADDVARTVAERAVHEIAIDDILAVLSLADAMLLVCADRAIEMLDHRTNEGTGDRAFSLTRHPVKGWRVEIRRRGTARQAAKKIPDLMSTHMTGEALKKAIAHIDFTDPDRVASLLEDLHIAQGTGAIQMLLRHGIADRIDLDALRLSHSGLERISDALHLVNADQEVGKLAERVAAEGSDLHLGHIDKVVEELQLAGKEETARAVAERAAINIDMNDSFDLAHRLRILHSAGARQALEGILSQDIATNVSLGHEYGVAQLLKTLQQIGANDAATELAERCILHLDISPYFAGDILEAIAATNIEPSSESDNFALRVADAGFFRECLNAFPSWREKFKFGREPDGTASPRWDWTTMVGPGDGSE